MAVPLLLTAMQPGVRTVKRGDHVFVTASVEIERLWSRLHFHQKNPTGGRRSLGGWTLVLDANVMSDQMWTRQKCLFKLIDPGLGAITCDGDQNSHTAVRMLAVEVGEQFVCRTVRLN